MWDILQECSEGKTVINKLTLINNVVEMRYRRDQNTGDHTAVIESQFVQMASTSTEFDDSTKLAMFTAIVKNCSEFEPFIMLVGIMKEKSHSWWPMCSLFIEETQRVTG